MTRQAISPRLAIRMRLNMQAKVPAASRRMNFAALQRKRQSRGDSLSQLAGVGRGEGQFR
jgi:hypothetical protein